MTRAALGGALSTSPDTVKGQPLPSLYSKDISSSCVCLSSHSVTAPAMTEIFKRKYGNSAGKLEDWIYQRSLTQFIPPRVGWNSRNIFFQPPANRDHPPWSLEAVSPFLPPSLVSTTPELPWSSVARHLLAAAATSDRFSAYHTLSPRSSSHSLQ